MVEGGKVQQEGGRGEERRWAVDDVIHVQVVQTKSSDCGRWTQSSAFRSTKVTLTLLGMSRLPPKTYSSQQRMTGEMTLKIVFLDLLSSPSSTIRQWNTHTGHCLHQLHGHEAFVYR